LTLAKKKGLSFRHWPFLLFPSLLSWLVRILISLCKNFIFRDCTKVMGATAFERENSQKVFKMVGLLLGFQTFLFLPQNEQKVSRQPQRTWFYIAGELLSPQPMVSSLSKAFISKKLGFPQTLSKFHTTWAKFDEISNFECS